MIPKRGGRSLLDNLVTRCEQTLSQGAHRLSIDARTLLKLVNAQEKLWDARDKEQWYVAEIARLRKQEKK